MPEYSAYQVVNINSAGEEQEMFLKNITTVEQQQRAPVTRTSECFMVQSQGSPHSPTRPFGGSSSSPELSFVSLQGCFSSGVSSASLAAQLWAVLQFHSSHDTSPNSCLCDPHLCHDHSHSKLVLWATSTSFPLCFRCPAPDGRSHITGTSPCLPHTLWYFPQGCACPMTTPPRIPALLPILHKDPHLKFERSWPLWFSFQKSIIKHSRKFWSHHFAMKSVSFSQPSQWPPRAHQTC